MYNNLLKIFFKFKSFYFLKKYFNYENKLSTFGLHILNVFL